MWYNYQPFGVPRIDLVNSEQDRLWGWADPGATVDVHVHRNSETKCYSRWKSEDGLHT